MTPDSNIFGIITAHYKIKLETRIKIMSRVGNIIAMKRKEQKISQGKCEELTAMGYPIKVSAYSSWETGISFPNAEQFLAVCKILKSLISIMSSLVVIMSRILWQNLMKKEKRKL